MSVTNIVMRIGAINAGIIMNSSSVSTPHHVKSARRRSGSYLRNACTLESELIKVTMVAQRSNCTSEQETV